MLKRVLSVIICIVMLVTTFAGCANSTARISFVNKKINKAQLVVAMNPIFAYDSENYSLAFNDVKNAIQSDSKGATLTSLSNSTNYSWAFRNGENWKHRGIYNLAKWNNGKGVYSNKINAYSFEEDGTISLLAYTTKVVDVKAYDGGTIPAYGVLLSASGGKQEAICYTVPETGDITIPSGTVTAVQSVDGIKTGFLAEDGTKRSGVIRIIVNGKEYYSDVLVNSAASENGSAVTELTYPAIENIPVTEGDYIFISVELNAELNKSEDISEPSDKSNSGNGYNNSGSKDKGDLNNSSKDDKEESKNISLIQDYESRFKIIYPEEASSETKKLVLAMQGDMEDRLEAAQTARSDSFDESKYEILIGNTNRKESSNVYDELVNYRPNHGADYIVRTVGSKLVISAASDYALGLAINYFMDNYCKDDKSVIPSNLNYVFRENKSTILLGSGNIASFTIRTEKYPSYMVVSAAKDLRTYILNKTGYIVPIVKGGTSNKNEILIGPNVEGLENLSDIQSFKTEFKNKTLRISVGSTTAANYAIQQLISQIDKGVKIEDGYSVSGKYTDKDYSLGNGYGLTWYDDFTGDYAKNGSKVNVKNWTTMGDTSNGPYYELSKVLDKIKNGIGGPWYTHKDDESIPEEYAMEGMQTRPGKEGENFFLRDDCLVEITRKSATGYEAVRLTTQNTMNFRYGVVESRFIAATNNGACSAFWLNLSANEIDVYENAGRDLFTPNLHVWKPSHIELNGSGAMPRLKITPAEGEHFYDTFHYMGFEWTENYFEFYLDGESICFVDISDSKYNGLRTPTAFKLANGVGTAKYSTGYNPGDYLGNDVNSFYEEQIWDFVRVYQKNEKKSVLRIK